MLPFSTASLIAMLSCERELESLLAAHAAGADYTEKPLDDIAAGMYLAEQDDGDCRHGIASAQYSHRPL